MPVDCKFLSSNRAHTHHLSRQIHGPELSTTNYFNGFQIATMDLLIEQLPRGRFAGGIRDLEYSREGINK